MQRIDVYMKFCTKGIVSNSDMIKNYKTCREKAEDIGKIIIFKNNQPDAVLFSISEYARIAPFLEYLETHDAQEAANALMILPKISSPEESMPVGLKPELQ